MGYFSNGTEGEDYRAQYCDQCANNGDDKYGEGCGIWDAHLVYNGEETMQPVLDLLIPVDAEGRNQRCTMFRLGERDRRQLPLFPG